MKRIQLPDLARVDLARRRVSGGTADLATRGGLGRGAWLGVAGAIVLACLAGCGPEELQTAYGRRLTPGASKSINGTAVFAEMFTQRGHSVVSRQALGEWLDRTDCIVWFPDDFAGPPEPVCARLTDWLTYGDERLLIYVGRDFDAAPLYFEKILPAVESEQRQRYEAIRDSLAQFHAMRRQTVENGDCAWFELKDSAPSRKLGPLSGRREWIEGIDQSRLDIRLGRRIVPNDGGAILLASGDDIVLSAAQLGQGRLVLAVNGSFLLNAPLVNAEHRKLAARLIDLAGPKNRKVVFLESGPGGPPLSDDPAPREARGGLGILVRPPYLWVFLSGLMLAVLFCMHQAMPFGPRKKLEETPTTDFGRHLAAVAALLKKTGDRSYATRQLLLYRQLTGESKRGRLPVADRLPRRAPLILSKAAAAFQSSDPSGPEGQ